MQSYGQPAAPMDNRCRHGRRTVVVCHRPPITWTAKENKTRAFTVAGIVKALILYHISCSRIHDYQLLSYSDAQTLTDWNADSPRRRWHRRTAAVAAGLSRCHRVPEQEDAALAPSARQGPGSARREDRCRHGTVGIRIELLACLREGLNRPRPLRMSKSALSTLLSLKSGDLHHSRNRVITGKV